LNKTCSSCGCGHDHHLYNCSTLTPRVLESRNMIIDSFTGKNRFLSNFYPCMVYLDGVSYPSVEHAYQAAKTLDKTLRVQFQSCTSAESKRLGTKLPLRSDWEQIKLQVMQNLLEQKFSKGSSLWNMLEKTKGNTLVEGNYWHDNVYGSCTCRKCGDKGRNELGKMLMQIRDNG
jgi:ribA/ribD-fused uncharacterized protein